MPLNRKPLRRVLLLAALALSLIAVIVIAPTPTPAAASTSSWGSGTLTDAELWNLIGQMTLAEKSLMIRGSSDTTCATANISPSVQGCQGQAGTVAGVARLGIPPLRLTDGPAGIRLSGNYNTALPAPVGLAASFSRENAYNFGLVMGKEGRATNQDVLLAPMINQVSFPTAGRNFETLGEDPFVLAELLVPQVEGMQDQGLIATLKHFTMNDFENNRMSTSVAIDEQTLYEGEMQAFEAGVKAGAGAIMCSYNRINDVYGCSNDIMQNQILRDEWGFEGFNMSDWGATHRSSDLIYGLDIAMPSGSTGNGWADATLQSLATNGSAAVALTNDFPAVPAYTAAEWMAAIDQAIFRILKQMNNAGLLEGTAFGTHYTDGTPYVPARPDKEALKTETFAVALEVAEDSATLLKNVNHGLPIRNQELVSRGGKSGVVFMGPTAVTPYIGGGGSANVTPYDNVISPYAAVKSTAKANAKISYVPGYDLDGTVMPATAVTAPAPFAGQNGWLRTQIDTVVPGTGVAPAPCTANCAPDQLDATVDYMNTTLPANTAWRWQATITAPSAGSYQLKVFVKDQNSAQLFVDGFASNQNRRVNLNAYATGSSGFGYSALASWDKMLQTAKSHDPNGPKWHQGSYTVTFAAGETHTLDLRAFAKTTVPLMVQFRWITPEWQSAKIAEAVAAAQSASKVIVFAYDEGTEGTDRGGNNVALGLTLPGYQDQLIAAVAAANPNTVVVLNTGDPVWMPWVNQVKAILQMWYPGQMGGVATANILLGTANPGGKLPVTFPASATAYPQYDPNCNPLIITSNPPVDGNCPLYPGVYTLGFLGVSNHNYKTVDMETNGIFVGYRWYDKHDVKPLFAFGHGLSYTEFRYSKKLVVTPTADGGYDVKVSIRNMGPMDGDEVVQLYLSAGKVPAGVQMAEKALVGFERLSLKRGETKEITIHIAPRQLSYWSVDAHDWVVSTGQRTLLVGSASDDIRAQTTLLVTN
jgi:beta-glucosidase